MDDCQKQWCGQLCVRPRVTPMAQRVHWDSIAYQLHLEAYKSSYTLVKQHHHTSILIPILLAYKF